MLGALDVRTWLTIAGVVVGFFLVPFAMLAHDHRREQRLHRRPRSQPTAGEPDAWHDRDIYEQDAGR